MTTLQMNIIAILSGSFSEKGNFSGYNAAGQRVHINSTQMLTLGYSKDTVDKKPIVFPLYTIAVEREFNVLNADGEPTSEKFNRLQAGSVFASKADAIAAFNADQVLNIEAKADLKKVAVAAGLSEASLKALEAVNV